MKMGYQYRLKIIFFMKVLFCVVRDFTLEVIVEFHNCGRDLHCLKWDKLGNN